MPSAINTADAVIKIQTSADRRRRHVQRRAFRAGVKLIEEARAIRPAKIRPILVGNMNSASEVSISTPGVNTACTPKKPAVVVNTSDTSQRRASSRARASRPIRTPSTTLTSAADSTNTKWAGRVSHSRSTLGMSSSSHNASIGRVMCISQFAVRIRDPGRAVPLRIPGQPRRPIRRLMACIK
ncbi:hypothetical protein [Mycobacterium genavense]|uniref:hypothetical protein n=1 Tax=Mycobacterium genavense TaxID=36812 RepID=UPI00046EC64C|nr:hypothetical protein [Mycobacterium genavense]